MGRKSETGGVNPKGDRIEVRFSLNNREVRPTLPLKPNAANLKHARRLRGDILEEIKAGTFQISDHFPEYRYVDQHVSADDPRGRTLRDWSIVWIKHSTRSLEHSTLAIYKRHLEAYWLKPFGGMLPKALTNEKILTHLAGLALPSIDTATGVSRKGLGRKTQNNILIPLRGVYDLICKAPGAPTNPTVGIDNLKVQKSGPDPFTLAEVDLALAHIRLHTRGGAEMADYFQFAAFAGFRPSEQIALLWADVDLRSKTFLVHRSRVLAEDKERTKTNRERNVEANARAWAVIERQRPRTQMANRHVFVNPITRGIYNDEQFQAREWMQALKAVGIRHRPPKELRDTSVSMNLSSGADPYWVAAQHGHSVTTMMRDYAKWIPQFDKGRNLAVVNHMMSSAECSAESGGRRGS